MEVEVANDSEDSIIDACNGVESMDLPELEDHVRAVSVEADLYEDNDGPPMFPVGTDSNDRPIPA